MGEDGLGFTQCDETQHKFSLFWGYKTMLFSMIPMGERLGSQLTVHGEPFSLHETAGSM